MKISRSAASQPLTEVILLEMETADYAPDFESELRKYRQKASFKGFRKGKTPMGFVKKMVGKSLMAEVVQKKLESSLYEYLENEKLDLLGQPIPADKEQDNNFDVNAPKKLTFEFEIGLAPVFEINGVRNEDDYSKYRVTIPAEEVNSELNRIRKQLGEYAEVEDGIQDDDILEIEAKELDGESIKEKGWDTAFSTFVSDLNDDRKAKVKTLKLKDVFQFDIYQLEKDKDEKYVRKYLLNLDEDEEKEIGHFFEGTIVKIKRQELAPLDQEFFDKAFAGQDIHNEEEAKAFIEKSISDMYGKQAEALLFRDIQERLLEKNTPEMPDAFLKRWLLVTNENLTQEQIDAEFDGFRKNLIWTIIRNRLIKGYDLNVEADEIRAAFRQQISGYFSGYDPGEEFMDRMVNQMMSERKQVEKVYDDILYDKLFEKIAAEISIAEKPIEKEAFIKIMEEARQAAKTNQLQALAEEEE